MVHRASLALSGGSHGGPRTKQGVLRIDPVREDVLTDRLSNDLLERTRGLVSAAFQKLVLRLRDLGLNKFHFPLFMNGSLYMNTTRRSAVRRQGHLPGVSVRTRPTRWTT